MNNRSDDDLPVFVQWVEFLKWLLPLTGKIPQKARFTFANRIDNLALDIVEDLVEARYQREKVEALKRANLRLEKLRVLMRISRDMQYISYKSYEFAMRALNETGKMIGSFNKIRQNSLFDVGRWTFNVRCLFFYLFDVHSFICFFSLFFTIYPPYSD